MYSTDLSTSTSQPLFVPACKFTNPCQHIFSAAVGCGCNRSAAGLVCSLNGLLRRCVQPRTSPVTPSRPSRRKERWRRRAPFAALSRPHVPREERSRRAQTTLARDRPFSRGTKHTRERFDAREFSSSHRSFLSCENLQFPNPTLHALCLKGQRDCLINA